jgi:hypothetical protein
MPSSASRQVIGRSTVEWTPADNLRWHEDFLRKLGAGDEDLAPLRAACKDWEAAEFEAAKDSVVDPCRPEASLHEAMEPVELPTGWKVAQPTNAARCAAAQCVLAVTGGAPPSPQGTRHVLLVGLWALWSMGDGRAAEVLRAINSAESMAELQISLDQAHGAISADDEERMAEAYLALMGMNPSEKKKQALEAMATYQAMATSLVAQTLASRSGPLNQESSRTEL